ncbi:hypothetical protein F5883DRAFT_533894 [Diaporthe sp. PMI_573]|nr:hypothetical protein F5883DRAFT_533894 [Diaporthaceae sp. PMI_573]
MSKRTPYQERIHHLLRIKFLQKENVGYDDEKYALRNSKFRGIVAKDPVAGIIRSYCIRKFSRDKIMECLYQPGQERHIEFDLGGMPNSSITSEYLERLSSHLQFESILKYVALPRLTI